MHLRPYQTDAITAVRRDWHNGTADTLLVAATGAGKTQIFLRIVMDELADPSARALVLAHRQELIDQPLDRIGKMDQAWLMAGDMLRPRVGIVMAERNEADRQLTIATVQSLTGRGKEAREQERYPRLERLLSYGPITHLVTDECHHATANTYVAVYNALKQANPNLRHLGVTATPMRGDGDGLCKVYKSVSAKVTIADLVKLGFLVQPRWLGISTGLSIAGVGSSNGDFVQSQLAEIFDTPQGREIITKAYQEYAAERRAIAFTASVVGAHDLAAAFNTAGVRAAAIDGTTPKELRRRLLADFRDGRIQVMVNCQVLTEGFDAPGTSCILMCRPTRSDSAYVQAMGRGLRPALGTAQPGEDCLILDFLPAETRNIVMAGDVLGLPKEVTRAAIREQDEQDPGMVQAGFTFDGEHFDTGGTPLEIIARQLDYLQASPFSWDRRDGWLTLGLGKGSDGIDRTLAIVPSGDQYVLYGLWRSDKTDGKWRNAVLATTESLDEIGEIGNEKAAQWGSSALTSKSASWLRGPITDGQRSYLLKLASRRELPKLETLNKGEAAKLITFYQAKQVLSRAGVSTSLDR